MIRVEYDSKDVSLSITGHANAGEYGHDLVCAGVSALWYAARLSSLPELQPEITEKSGECRLRLKPCREAYTIIETVVNGMEALSVEFPHNVSVYRR